jgi:cystathionine gamma-synthase
MTFSASKATQAVRAAIESDTQHGAVVPPLHLSSKHWPNSKAAPAPWSLPRAWGR